MEGILDVFRWSVPPHQKQVESCGFTPEIVRDEPSHRCSAQSPLLGRGDLFAGFEGGGARLHFEEDQLADRIPRDDVELALAAGPSPIQDIPPSRPEPSGAAILGNIALTASPTAGRPTV